MYSDSQLPRIRGYLCKVLTIPSQQWDLPSIWESRNVWLPIEINEEERSLEVVWHDIYDLNV